VTSIIGTRMPARTKVPHAASTSSILLQTLRIKSQPARKAGCPTPATQPCRALASLADPACSTVPQHPRYYHARFEKGA
jgi:hypothetical protein